MVHLATKLSRSPARRGVSSRAVLVAGVVVLWGGVTCLAWEPAEPADDYATLQYEQFFGASTSGSRLEADETFPGWWAYVSLPGFRVLGKNVFTALELDIVNREMVLDGLRLTENPMQRYGFFGGITLVEREKNRGSFMAGTGIASDFAEPGSDALYLHLIYDHRFEVSEKLSLGIGVVFPFNFGETRTPVVNLLPTVRWRVSPTTFLKVAWDVAELRQYLWTRLCLVGEARYDMSFFRLKQNTTVELETAAAGGGVDVQLARALYLRLRCKKLLMKNELVRRNGTDLVVRRGADGWSVRCLLVHAK